MGSDRGSFDGDADAADPTMFRIRVRARSGNNGRVVARRPARERRAIAAVAALAATLLACGGEVEVAEPPPGSFSFAVFGDAPYAGDDRIRVERLIEELNREELAFVVHVGDILWFPCSDEVFEDRRALFSTIRHPLIYAPGDNEWVDCWEPKLGGYRPLERLARLRQVFFARPGRSLGGRELALETQGGEFVEHARWVHAGLVFATLHVPGSGNASFDFPGRGADDDEEVARREAAAIGWLEEAFARARQTAAPAVVLALHAEMSLGAPPGDPARRGFERLIGALERQVAGFDGEVLLVHGDDHAFQVDRPLAGRAVGPPLENLTRLETFGSPEVGWVRVTVDPGPPVAFTFEPRPILRGWWWIRRLVTGPPSDER